MTDDTTLFKRVDYEVGPLLNYIDIGDIALPDIQRPFVWPATKVRDLFDSMYRGFPIGYLLFWGNPGGDGVTTRRIGLGEKAHSEPNRLIVDGQQRLTSLYAVFRGKPVMNQDFREFRMEIAFKPRDGRFEVADAAIRRDPEFIANVSDFLGSASSSFRLITDFLARLKLHREVSHEEENRLSRGIERLMALVHYPLTALEIAGTVDEEQVADIFVRINSEGIKLNQADFILTLLSVFWEEGRQQLEAFCRESRRPPAPSGPPSPFNHFIQPSPDQLIRVGVATGFNRGRLRAVYQVLRGKDPSTETYTRERREAQLERLRQAQAELLELGHWHGFFQCLVGAGFRSGELVSSGNTLLYTYALYLTGRTRFQIAHHQLQRLIGRWFYAAVLTDRYIGSFESVVDQDMARIRDLADSDEFVALLERIMAESLTNDFWAVTLPSELETSAARSPEFFAFLAAQNKLGASVLFSHQKLADVLDPTLKLKKKAIDKHHLFPRAWLERQGIASPREINQVANFAMVEWPDNIDISDTPPAEYVPLMRERFDRFTWRNMSEVHALPDGWESMPYGRFLDSRRPLMAAVIRRAYESLGPAQQAAAKDQAGA
ncbi:MAG: DUF262 domain-containing protein [Candidatus Dormibacteraeota bacterium]|nr:DUF262 domain-containing protein [Candidatus Dormibacteraeota bacterium]